MAIHSVLVRCLVLLLVSLGAFVRTHGQNGAAPQAVGSFACGACFSVDDSGAVQFVPLESTEVVLGVRAGLVEAEVIQTFSNRGSTALEAIYRYPLPLDATLTHFELRYQDRVISSVVREKGQARAAYEAAKAEGRKTAILERDDPTLFSTAVANFLPGETVQTVLRFVQPLDMWSDGFEVRFPMVTGEKYFPAGAQPGVGGNSAPTPERAASGMWGPGHVYAFDVTIAGVPVERIESPSHGIRVESGAGDAKFVRLEDEITVPDRDFIMRVKTGTGRSAGATWVTQTTATGTYGVIAVFPPVHSAASPGQSGVKPRDLLFLIDRSGSMAGTRLENAKKGLDVCLGSLRREDRFQIVAFSSGHEFYSESWVEATAPALQKARAWVGNLVTDGGTELQQALRDCLDAFERNRREKILIVLTDGDVGDERSIMTLVESRRRDTRIFPIGIGDAPNPTLIRKLAAVGHGQARFIARDALIARELEDFFVTLDSPVLSDVRVTFLATDGTQIPHTAFPETLPEVFHARPAQSVIRFAGEPPTQVVVSGEQDGRPFSHALALDAARIPGDGLEKLFGMRWVDELEDMLRRATTAEERAMISKELLDTALQFQLVTELTSRVAVDRVAARPDVNGSQPLPLVRVNVPQAQVADQSAASMVDPNDPDLVVLANFCVSTESDEHTTATTLAGTRLRTALRDMGANVQVVSREMLDDTGATSLEDALHFMAEPVERPDVAQGGSESGTLDGLPIHTVLDMTSISRVVARPGGPIWSTTDQLQAEASARSRIELRGSDDGFMGAACTLAGDPSRDGSMPLLGQVSWSHFDGADWSARASAADHFDDGLLTAQLQWRSLSGYGDARLAQVAAQRDFGDTLQLGADFAWHELRRDDPVQFARDTAKARQQGLGFTGLDQLTAPTEGLSDTIARIRAMVNLESGAVRHRMHAMVDWHERTSDWFISVPDAIAPTQRSDLGVDMLYQASVLRGVATVGLAWNGAHHRLSDGRESARTSRRSAEVVFRLGEGFDLFGSRGVDEILPWLTRGTLVSEGGTWRMDMLPTEQRATTELGVRIRSWSEKFAVNLSWFRDEARNHAYRDWAWERDHVGPTPTVNSAAGERVRLPWSMALWPHQINEGWAGSLDFNPSHAFTLTASWYLGDDAGGPYLGDDRRFSALARYRFQSGILRRATLGFGATYRSALEFNDGYRLDGGTQLNAMAAYRFGPSRGRGLNVQVNLIDATDRAMQPTRYAVERGRRWMLTVTRGF